MAQTFKAKCITSVGIEVCYRHSATTHVRSAQWYSALTIHWPSIHVCICVCFWP